MAIGLKDVNGSKEPMTTLELGESLAKIKAGYGGKVTIAFIARELGISERHAQRCYRLYVDSQNAKGG